MAIYDESEGRCVENDPSNNMLSTAGSSGCCWDAKVAFQEQLGVILQLRSIRAGRSFNRIGVVDVQLEPRYQPHLPPSASAWGVHPGIGMYHSIWIRLLSVDGEALAIYSQWVRNFKSIFMGLYTTV